MRRRMLKSKIHRATVTGADVEYVGSITLDVALMRRADILEWEQVQVLDIDNGARLETYAIPGGTGEVCLNGAAARLVHPGDRVIVLTYADLDNAELEGYEPTVVHVDRTNRPVSEEVARDLACDRSGPGRFREPEPHWVDAATAAELDLIR